MKTKHTQGEWTINPNLLTEVIIPSKMGMEIDVWHYAREEDEAEANAKLIAAAPELLEMLIRISNIENYAFTLPGFDVKRLKSEINQAIEKAINNLNK